MAYLRSWRLRQRFKYFVVACTFLCAMNQYAMNAQAEIFFGPVFNPDSSNGGCLLYTSPSPRD